MRLFKYLVISNDLIDHSTIYMLNPNDKWKSTNEDRKVTVLDAGSIGDYSNNRLVEILFNREYKYKGDYYEKLTVSLSDEATAYSFNPRHLDKIKDEYLEEVKGYIEAGETDFIATWMYKDGALISESDKALNKQRAENILLSKHIRSKLMSLGYQIKDLRSRNSMVNEGSIVLLMDNKQENITVEDIFSFVNENKEDKKDIVRRKKSRSKKNQQPQKIAVYDTKLITREILAERDYKKFVRLVIYDGLSYQISIAEKLFQGLDNYDAAIPTNFIYAQDVLIPAYIENELKVLNLRAMYEKYEMLLSVTHENGLQANLLESFNEFLEEARQEIKKSENYLSRMDEIISSLDEQTIKEKRESYFVYTKLYKKVRRNVRSRIDNGLYLLKPYQDKSAIALMDFTYSNTTDKSFKMDNKAYSVIDIDKGSERFGNIKGMIELVAGKGYHRNDYYSEGYLRANRHYDRCEDKAYCTGESCLNTEYIKFIGNTWNTFCSSHSTKRVEKSGLFGKGNPDKTHKKSCYDHIEKMQPRSRKAEEGIRLVAPNTDGIITTKARFESDNIEETVMTLHQWLKCSSISGKQKSKARSEIAHVGHTFDNRVEYLERLAKDRIDGLKDKEAEQEVFRSEYVTVGTSYFSNTIECNCSAKKGAECQYCEGVLYIDSEQGLKDLYDQLTSEEYSELKKNSR